MRKIHSNLGTGLSCAVRYENARTQNRSLVGIPAPSVQFSTVLAYMLELHKLIELDRDFRTGIHPVSFTRSMSRRSSTKTRSFWPSKRSKEVPTTANFRNEPDSFSRGIVGI